LQADVYCSKSITY